MLVSDNGLYFLHDESELLITDGFRVLIKESENKFNREFNLFDGKEKLLDFIYSLPEREINISPFEYIDDEDFKWGDFLKNTIEIPERRQNFINVLMEGS